MKKIKMGLLAKLAIGIVIGIIIGAIAPLWLMNVIVTLSGLFSNYLNFMVPLIIIAFVVPGIADLGHGAGKVLGFSVFMSYSSTVLWAFIALFVSLGLLPMLLGGVEQVAVGETLLAAQPLFEIDMPQIMNITSAILLAFILGIGISVVKGKALQGVFNDLNKIVNLTLEKSIIPFLPFYIAAVFAELTFSGNILDILKVYGLVFLLVIAFQIIANFLEYVIARLYAKPSISFTQMLKNQIPSWMTGLGTQSSAATIPITLQTAEANGVSKDVRDFFIPLSATIHFPGSSIAITIYAVSVMMMNGMPIKMGVMTGFIFLMGITMVAAPGIPGGAVMAAIGLLQAMLGFNEMQVALMIALYLAQDSFGTAASVAGNSALVLIIDKQAAKKMHKA